MYTLGTSALKYIADHGADFGAPDIEQVLAGKLVAFVGTQQEFDESTPDTTMLNAYTVFFVAPASTTDPYKIQQPLIGPVNIHVTVDTTGTSIFGWTAVVATLSTQAIIDSINVMSGYPTVINAIQRGNFIDRTKARQMDGVLFYARDIKTLYIYDSYVTEADKWVQLTSVEMPVGVITVFANADSGIPDGWLRCDGASISKLQYPELFEVLEYLYTEPSVSGGEMFNLPVRDNSIIRAEG